MISANFHGSDVANGVDSIGTDENVVRRISANIQLIETFAAESAFESNDDTEVPVSAHIAEMRRREFRVFLVGDGRW